MNTKLTGPATRRTVAALVALLATALTLVLLASPARADTVIVNNTFDPGNGTCDQKGCTLREAIAAAKPEGTIRFAPGVNGIIALGDELVVKDLTIEGPGANKLDISGSNSHVVMQVWGTVEVSDVTISDGAYAGGGGIWAGSGSRLFLDKVSITNNEAINMGVGGGVSSHGYLDIRNSTVYGNRARIGGGIKISSGGLRVTNSTISGNEATLFGGGIDVFGTDDVEIRHTTISDNISGTGANLQVREYNGSGFADLDNTIVANPLGGGKNCSITKSNRHSGNLDSDSSCFNRNAGAGTTPNITGVDPKLGNLTYYGGPTKTHSLLKGSPAIDKGGSCPAKDQRGTTRPQDGDRNGSYKCDIGAYELGGPPLDKAKPIISRLSPKPGAKTRDRTPTIQATVKDNATNLKKSNIKLYVDGRRKINFKYSTSADRLTYTTSRLAYKRHSVKIVAKDAAGNTAAKSWRFTVKKR